MSTEPRKPTDPRKNAHHYWQHVALDGTVSPRVYVGPPNTTTDATKQPQTAEHPTPGHPVTPRPQAAPHNATEGDT